MIKIVLKKEALLQPEKATEKSFNLFLTFLKQKELRKDNNTRMDKKKGKLVLLNASLN